MKPRLGYGHEVYFSLCDVEERSSSEESSKEEPLVERDSVSDIQLLVMKKRGGGSEGASKAGCVFMCGAW